MFIQKFLCAFISIHLKQRITDSPFAVKVLFNISLPTSCFLIKFLNETREKLDDMLCRGSDEYGFYRLRMCRKKAGRDYPALAKCRKRGAKKIRKTIKKQLQYIRLCGKKFCRRSTKRKKMLQGEQMNYLS